MNRRHFLKAIAAGVGAFLVPAIAPIPAMGGPVAPGSMRMIGEVGGDFALPYHCFTGFCIGQSVFVGEWLNALEEKPLTITVKTYPARRTAPIAR